MNTTRDPIPLIDALTNENVQAFYRVVRIGEGTDSPDGYRMLFGGHKFYGLDGVPDTFDDFSDHPRRVQTFKLKKGQILSSTAAGASQFLARTWDEIAELYGLKDFTPKSQDIAFVGLLIRRKALDDVIAGRFEQAVLKCNKEWASLPESPYGQPTRTMAQAEKSYLENGGDLA